MIKSIIEPECTGQFTSIFLDYIQQKESLQPFYHLFPTMENFRKLAERRTFDEQRRAVLVHSLKAQYEGFDITEQIGHNIQSLEHSNTFTVTTGHQLNLFTGPLYFFYKIVSTINLADKLNQAYPAYRFVPVYWMASEDHDFAEINHFHFDGEVFSWDTDQMGAVGEFKLDKGIKDLLKRLAFVPDFFKKAYLEHTTLADAVRYYVNHLFGEKGLIIVDGNNKDLKTLFRPVIKDDLLNNRANELVNKTSEKMEHLGYKGQIYPREINFFYLDKGLRERIAKVGEKFQVLDKDLSFSENEMLDLIENSPEKFSPNVVMRPLYQEYILPNIAYLGGPAEVAYWLQLKSVFEFYQTDFPAVMPRNFVMILDNKAQRKIQALELSDREIFSDYVSWKKDYVRNNSGQDISLSKEKEALSGVFDQLRENAMKIDPTLKGSSMAAKTRANKILDQFSVKLRKAEERNLASALRQMQDLKEMLFPGGNPQERKNNFLMFYLEDPKFIEKLYSHLDPLNFDFIILRK
ncbi:MAG: bacillithiol biosynthesis cysteine-adding enzyme BshC [Anditalea sp.]